MDEMGKGLVGLAEARFGKTKLNAAEKKFFKGVGDGEVVDLRKGDEEFDKPDNAENWKGRRIRSDRVAWLCSDGDALGMVTHKGISVFGARFDEELDLSYAQMPFRLVFRECAFAEKVNLRMVSAREIIFNGSHTKVINGNSLSVEGWLHFAEGFRAEEQVCLQDAKAGGLYCSKGVFVNPKGTALNCGGIEVKGDVFLSDDFSSEGEVSFWGAAIGGILSCTNGKFSNTKREKPEGVKKTDERRALHCDGIKVKGGVFLDNGFSSEGVVRFPSATIGGVLSCTNGKFSN
ncbi:MAG: hypothetical protein KAS23_11170, partial [Anaerohalosphaera sp.]|nr:hypothetical protein [Anaerohalosphaera sp.]